MGVQGLRLCLSFVVMLLFNGTSLGAEEPWGRDADLVLQGPEQCNKDALRLSLNSLAEKLIIFHQEVISPADGPRSHYKPSSSQYTLEAMRKYGFLEGFLWGCDRLMRENNDPWVYEVVVDPAGEKFKWDPVK